MSLRRYDTYHPKDPDSEDPPPPRDLTKWYYEKCDRVWANRPSSPEMVGLVLYLIFLAGYLVVKLFAWLFG